MTHHRNAFKANLNRPIYSHIKSHGHNKDFTIFTITINDCLTDQFARKTKETEYIELLKTKLPFGLNVKKTN